MNIFELLMHGFIIAAFIGSLRATLYAIFLWQLKEYRLDRMVVYLSTKQGRQWMFGLFSISKWLVLGALILTLVLPYPFLIYLVIGLIVYTEAALFFRDWYRGSMRQPQWTIKALSIFGIVTLVQSVYFIYYYDSALFPYSYIIFDKLRPFIIAALIILSNLISWVWYRFIIFRAKKKLEQFPKLIKVGITGSFGKTSTKEFLATILATKYSVVKTPEKVNTAIGVAQTILSNDLENAEVFIAEMGAYKKGEIREIADFVKPSIGIVTGINEQHIELFGSLQNTMKAKYELIESLPKKGVAVFNNDNQYVQEMISWTHKRDNLAIVTYGLSKSTGVYADDIKVELEKISFTIHHTKRNTKIAVPFLGKQHIPNILAAITTALKLNLSLEEIKKSMSQISAPSKTMAKAGYCNGALLVDDTFNANPEGIKAAIEYMRIAKGQKVLVLTPLIELGDEARRIHEELGKYASSVCDYIFVTNENYIEDFLKNIPAAKQKHVIYGLYATLTQKLKDIVRKGDVVVFEGKEAGNVLKLLQPYD